MAYRDREDDMLDNDAANIVEYTTKVKGHDCHLVEAEHPIIRYIYHGLFVECRRKFRIMMLVNPEDPDSKAKLRSTAKIREEQERQLKYYYYMIHPYSRARDIWETIMIWIYLIEFTFTPFDVALGIRNKWFQHLVTTGKMVLIIDCILWFFTGYYDDDRQRIVMDPKKVAWSYCTTYFAFDFLTVVPFGLILRCANLSKPPWTHIRVVFILRLARTATFINYFQIFLERRGLHSALILKIIRVSLALIIILSWTIALRCFLRGFPKGTTDSQRIKISILEVVSKLMLVGTGTSEQSLTITLLLKDIFFLTGGSFVTKYMLLQVMDIYKRKSGTRHQYETTMVEIDEYMHYKRIPRYLKIRIYHYLDFRFQKQILKESDLFAVLSTTLVEEILLHKCQEMVERVDIFQNLPLSLVVKLITRMRLEAYLPRDVIAEAGKHGSAMYFVYEGSVAVYSPEKVEICHLQTGDHFGEIGLMMKRPRAVTIVAVEECELYRLNRKDFQEVLQPYPRIYRRMRHQTIGRLKKIEVQLATSRYTSDASLLF